MTREAEIFHDEKCCASPARDLSSRIESSAESSMSPETSSERHPPSAQAADGPKGVMKRGRGRPRRDDAYERLGVHIPGDVAHQLRRHVATHKRSLSDVVAEALRAALAREEDQLRAA